uniref:Uncharacterized protein n=1 Tax=Oryza rufipogon TaxID=4529 RepID=A0A0E0PS56_ORYRU
MRKAGRSVVEEKKSILGVGGRGSRLVLLVFEVVAGDEDAAVEALGAGAADPGEVGPDHEGEVAALVEVDAGGAFAGVPVVEVLLVAPASDGVGSPGVPAVPPDVEALGEAVAGGGADLAVAAHGVGPPPRLPRQLVIPPHRLQPVARAQLVVAVHELPRHPLVPTHPIGPRHQPPRWCRC